MMARRFWHRCLSIIQLWLSVKELQSKGAPVGERHRGGGGGEKKNPLVFLAKTGTKNFPGGGGWGRFNDPTEFGLDSFIRILSL